MFFFGSGALQEKGCVCPVSWHMQGAGTVPMARQPYGSHLHHHDVAYLVVHSGWVLHQELDLSCACDLCGGDSEGAGT